MLSATDVTFDYGTRGHGPSFELQPLTLEIQMGSITGLLGPNGCGKTTLLKLLSGVLQPHSGHVTLQRGERSRLADYAAEVL